MINQGQWTAVYQHTPLQRMAEDAYRLWLGYYADCERYDRTVCTGGRDKDGDARPVGHNERALICAHAATRHAAVTRDLAAARVTPDASFAARRAACVLRFEDAEHELARLTARAERTFMERACAGEFGDLHTAIDDAIDAWHTGPEGPPLHVALGMTWDEYAAWVKSPRLLDEIVASHAAKETSP